MNEWMPIEVWNEDTQEFKSRPIVLQITRNLTAFMTFLIQLIRETFRWIRNYCCIYELGLD